jgi:hypothetical protein
VCERIRRINDRGLKVLGGEVRIGIEEVLVGRAFPELPQYELYSNTGTTNDGLSQHHLGIDLDSTVR